MSQKSADRIIELFIPVLTILIAFATLFLSNNHPVNSASLMLPTLNNAEVVSKKDLSDLPDGFRQVLVNNQRVTSCRQLLEEGDQQAYELSLADNSKMLVYIGEEGIMEIGAQEGPGSATTHTPVYIIKIPVEKPVFFFSQFGILLLVSIILLLIGLVWSRHQTQILISKLSPDHKWPPLTESLLETQRFRHGFFSVFTWSNPAEEELLKSIELKMEKIHSLNTRIQQFEENAHKKFPGLSTR